MLGSCSEHTTTHQHLIAVRLRRQVTDTGLGTLTRLRQLTVLDIMYCHRITDAGVLLLAGSHLSNLNITGCSRLTHRGKQHVSHMTCTVNNL